MSQITNLDYFRQEIEKAKPNYEIDNTWYYRLTGKDYEVVFYKDEIGKNHLDFFKVCGEDFAFDFEPTEKMIKLMWEKLNNTPYA
jgi:hypothetical protein